MYTDRYIYIKTFIITILICFFIQCCIWMLKLYSKNKISEVVEQDNIDNIENINNSINETKNIIEEAIIEKEEVINNSIQENLNMWKVEIPKINLIACIQEGVSSDILSKSVGHFEETSRTDGNIGLAAHNRGYNMNFFENIKKLDIGDKILYTYEETTREYIVEKLTIIKETDWSYLEQTQDNRVTLITCVKDSPEYRLCVQGKQNIEIP